MHVSFARCQYSSLLNSVSHRHAGVVYRIVGVMLMTLAVGCNQEKPQFPSATIQGTVTIDGAPVKEGTLQFMPGPNVKGQVAQAKIIDGKFTAKTVPVGQVRVMFNITRATGKMITEYSTPYPEIENLVPKNSRDGVDLTVGGNETVKFDLLNDPAVDATSSK